MTFKLTHEQTVAIVGVDEKEPADFAVVTAHRLAPALKLEIELVHASTVPLDYFSHLDPLGIERARTASAQRWAALLAKEGATNVATPQLEIVAGRPADVLIERGRARDAGLIVIGRHQQRPGFDFGDVVRDVVVRADRPVWVQAGAPRPIRRVLCPIDLGPNGLEVLALARDVARALGAELVALHCFVRPQLGFLLGYPLQFPTSMIDTARESAEREFRRLLEPFDWRGVIQRRLFYEADPTSELVSLQSEFDLIVLGTHGRTGVAKVLLGSVAAELLRKATIPILVTRSAS